MCFQLVLLLVVCSFHTYLLVKFKFDFIISGYLAEV
jgi:hypothetical protein